MGADIDLQWGWILRTSRKIDRLQAGGGGEKCYYGTNFWGDFKLSVDNYPTSSGWILNLIAEYRPTSME